MSQSGGRVRHVIGWTVVLAGSTVGVTACAGTDASIYFGQRGGAFSAGGQLSDSTIAPYALAVADLDRGGRMDVIVGHVEAPSSIHFSDGSGRHFRVVRFGDSKGTVYGFAVGDLDRDGLPDVAVARSDAPNVVYFADRGPSKSR